jgi:arginyl-tRNA synthetase
LEALSKLGVDVSDELRNKITISYPDPKFGDFATNAALILSKQVKKNPIDLAKELIEKIGKDMFESVELAGPGFINFRIKNEVLIRELQREEGTAKGNNNDFSLSSLGSPSTKILLEYFQPNIAKPLHIGHFRTAIIGDALKRMMKFAGLNVESDTHLGDWGTQFGLLLLAYKNYGDEKVVAADPITELNKLYVQINEEIEHAPSIRESGKKEFVKLEQGDVENRKIWKQFVDWSLEKFNKLRDELDLLPFENNWPESFYEDKMPVVLDKMKEKGILVESQGAQIVNLEDQKLGIAVIVKSDGGTTYLLRDLATFIYVRQQGFTKHLYVVDNRQSHHYNQLFAILKLMEDMEEGEGEHIDYGFISFKGEALSTRKGNMVLADDVIDEAKKRVAKIVKEKNPDLPDKAKVIHAVAIGALKYYDLSHNRHSEFEFDWDEALDFEGNSGPYLQYAYARLSGILTKVNMTGKINLDGIKISETEHELMVKILGLEEVVPELLKEYLPNLLANYLYELSGLINKFYHESPVMKEEDGKLKYFRLQLIQSAKEVLGKGLGLLGIEALEEM